MTKSDIQNRWLSKIMNKEETIPGSLMNDAIQWAVELAVDTKPEDASWQHTVRDKTLTIGSFIDDLKTGDPLLQARNAYILELSAEKRNPVRVHLAGEQYKMRLVHAIKQDPNLMQQAMMLYARAPEMERKMDEAVLARVEAKLKKGFEK